MLRVGGKDVIYSASFLMASGEEAVLEVPGIIGRTIKMVAQEGVTLNAVDHDDHVELTVPFGVPFEAELERSQLVTKKGPVTCRVVGRNATKYLEVRLDVLEGRYDNYVEPGTIEDYLDSEQSQQ